MSMTSKQRPLDIGPPMPITKLTVEQEFKMRQIRDAVNSPAASKEDIITVFIALQEQCFILSNNIAQLVKTWPLPQTTTPEETLRSGISSEIKS